MNVLFLNLPYKFDISRASRWPEKRNPIRCIIRIGWHMRQG